MWSLLFITMAYAATIPPSVPSVSPCLQKCFEEGTILQAANDLNNFKKIAIDIEMFCQVNAAVLKCGRECPDIPELETRTAYSSYICTEKIEEFRIIKDCMGKAPDAVDSCMQDCGLPAAAFRFDSSGAALVGPTAFFDGLGTSCDKHVCGMKCSINAFDKVCSGSGELLKDLGRFQVMTGTDRLNQTAQKENETNQQIVLNYLKNLPAKCAYMTDAELFDIAVLHAPGKELSGDSAEGEVATTITPEELEKKIIVPVPVQFNADASVTTAVPDGSTVEFEPSNEPDVPVGPPEVGATVEPAKEVEGQPETDEFIIDHDGRANTNFAKSSTSEMETTTEMVTEPGNDVAPATNPEEEPVIVIDNKDNKTDSNDINESTAAEVKAGTTGFTIFVISLFFLFAL